MNQQINTLYFSATGTTEKIVGGIAQHIHSLGNIRNKIKTFDFTLPEARKQSVSFSPSDLVIVGVPVIAGRVPNILLKYLNGIKGNGALAVAVVVYGNRNYDDALIELQDILEADGFKVVAGGAFIGEHSFSQILGQGRPDERDMEVVKDLAGQIYKKITGDNEIETVNVKGNRPYRDYYRSKDREGNPVDFRKITPQTTDDCIDCKLCAEVCPMGSIDIEDVSKLNGICIKCCACVKKCPVNAKHFGDENFIKHKNELEIEFARRSEPEIFV